MSQGNKYEGSEVPGFRKWKAHSRVAVNARKPFAPVAAPRPAGKLDSPAVVFVFSLHRGRLSATLHTSDAATRASTRISAANRRQNHKNFAAVGTETGVGKRRSPSGQRAHAPVMIRLVTLTAGRKKQRGGPSTRKQSLTEAKHEKRGPTEFGFASSTILSPP